MHRAGATARSRWVRPNPTVTACSICARTCTNGAAIGTIRLTTPFRREDNPQGPPTGARRASRGGAWRHHIKIARCAARSSIPPEFRYADYGFRIAAG